MLVNMRKTSRLTQGQLADRAGVSRATVARYEAGAFSPPIDTLQRLVGAMGGVLRIEIRRSDPQEPPATSLTRRREAVLDACARAGGGRVWVCGAVAARTAQVGDRIELLVEWDAGLGEVGPAVLTDELAKILGHKVAVTPLCGDTDAHTTGALLLGGTPLDR